MEEKKYQVHTHIIIVVVSVLALILSIISLVKNNTPTNEKVTTIANEASEARDGESLESYKIYIGLTDKKLNYQKLKTDVAKEIIKNICISNNHSYTLYEVEGAHPDKDKVLHAEQTIIVEMNHIDDKELENLAKTFCQRLNIQSVMVSKNQTYTYYYSD